MLNLAHIVEIAALLLVAYLLGWLLGYAARRLATRDAIAANAGVPPARMAAAKEGASAAPALVTAPIVAPLASMPPPAVAPKPTPEPAPPAIASPSAPDAPAKPGPEPARNPGEVWLGRTIAHVRAEQTIKDDAVKPAIDEDAAMRAIEGN